MIFAQKQSHLEVGDSLLHSLTEFRNKPAEIRFSAFVKHGKYFSVPTNESLFIFNKQL
jgi:hypothetical protein